MIFALRVFVRSTLASAPFVVCFERVCDIRGASIRAVNVGQRSFRSLLGTGVRRWGQMTGHRGVVVITSV